MRTLKNILLLLVLFSLSCATKQGTQLDQQNSHHVIKINSEEELKEFYTWTEDRLPMVSAHRGGPYPGFPENAIETFENVLRYTPAIIECDVELTKDSLLVMMHDRTLDRTTSGSGRVFDHTLAEIKALQLKDNEGTLTNFQAPTLQEVLTWSKGKALLTVDVKRNVPFELVVNAIEETGAELYAAVITYSLADAIKVHNLNPALMLSVTVRNEAELEALESSGIALDRVIAFTGTSERPQAFNELLHQKGIFTILGVLGNIDKSAEARGDQLYEGFIARGADILATDRPIEAAKVIQSLNLKSSKSKFFELSTK
ncbi:glycerophosphodiester phosphodiesterase family protein [Penaeicola halotolerans]|uniref:glycerophosphodiester phosphodiesterase family protein n=1 Tax=Penaeicola halotolerans TaxID=2793196 RepID=UPI001CF909F5|nr:glycerophosphodiester phosphodiesterase family protein [Penaeicola halotolerans]